jgi:hypothetical protein
MYGNMSICIIVVQYESLRGEQEIPGDTELSAGCLGDNLPACSRTVVASPAASGPPHLCRGIHWKPDEGYNGQHCGAF